jgi:hypothetical protein
MAKGSNIISAIQYQSVSDTTNAPTDIKIDIEQEKPKSKKVKKKGGK